MHKNGICVITPRQAHDLEMYGTVPLCHRHRHMSRGQADLLIADHVRVQDDLGNYRVLGQARWVGKGKRWLVYERARSWKKLPSAGFAVLQLVAGGAA